MHIVFSALDFQLYHLVGLLMEMTSNETLQNSTSSLNDADHHHDNNIVPDVLNDGYVLPSLRRYVFSCPTFMLIKVLLHFDISEALQRSMRLLKKKLEVYWKLLHPVGNSGMLLFLCETSLFILTHPSIVNERCVENSNIHLKLILFWIMLIVISMCILFFKFAHC